MKQIDYSKYEGHTPGDWEWARGEYTREEFLVYCAESWDRADPNPYDHTMSVVQVDDENGENLTICILGNGPTAHRNGPLIADAPDLLDACRERDEEIARLREALNWYEVHAFNARRVGSEGEDARRALDQDGGKKARAALADTESQSAYTSSQVSTERDRKDT